MSQSSLVTIAGIVTSIVALVLTLISFRVTRRSRGAEGKKSTSEFSASPVIIITTVGTVVGALIAVIITISQKDSGGAPTHCVEHIELTSPRTGTLAVRPIRVTGTGQLCNGDTLWLTLRPDSSVNYFVAGRIEFTNNSWNVSVCPPARIGEQNSIDVVVANHAADHSLASALTGSGFIKAPPSGADIVATVTVVNAGGVC